MISKSTASEIKKIGDFLSKLAERSEQVYWLSSPDFKSITYVSPAYEKIWGRSREELYQNPEQWITFLAPEDVKGHHPIHAMAARIAEKGPDARYNESYRIVRPDGQIRWILDCGFPIYNDEGECCGVTGVAVDITREKEVEIKLREAKEAAESANAFKTEFIRNMSHDLRTPLAGIIGMAGIISLEPEASIIKEGASDIQEAGKALLSLLNDIIETIQVESGSMLHKKSIFSLKKTLVNLTAMFKPALKEKNLTLETYYDDHIPELLYGEELLLHRIVLNLLSNAVKFTQKGFVGLEVSVLQKKPDSISLKIVVKDTGIGIPDEKQKVIFEKFSRLSPSHNNQYKGSGLGLFMVKQFIQKLGGDIQVSSTHGKGSQFICTVQFKMPTAAQLAKQQAREESMSQGTVKKKTAPVGEKLRALLVEDTLLPRKVAANLLIKAGYDIELAETAAEALIKSEQKAFDMIFLDVGLPDGSGVDVTKAIRTNPSNPNVGSCIVILTAHADEQIKEVCLSSGAQDVMDKPLTPEKIEEAEQAMNKRLIVMGLNKTASVQQNKMPILDIEHMKHLTGGNIKTAMELLDMFIKDLPNAKKQLQEAYEANDERKLQYYLHRLHGDLCYSGAMRLKSVTAHFEKQVMARATDSYASCYADMMREIDTTVAEYDKIVRK